MILKEQKYIYKKIIFFPLFFLVTYLSFSIPDSVEEQPRYGIFYDYKLNDHKADFQRFKDVPNCCPQFNNGFGTGYSIGLSWELPMPYSLRIGLRGAYSILDGTLSSIESTTVRLDNNFVDGEFTHYINANINDLGFEPFLSFNPFGGFEIFGGGHIGFLTKMTFDQYEKITQPSDRGVFVDTRTRIRNQRAGNIPEAKEVYSGLIFGAAYNISLNKSKSVFLTPEISIIIGQTDLVKDLKWTVNSVQIGLALKYSPEYKPEPKKIFERKEFKYNIDTTRQLTATYDHKTIVKGEEKSLESRKIKGDSIITTINLYRTDTLFIPQKPKVGLTTNTPLIYMQTQYVSQAFPILPVVFFGKDSFVITDFYNKLEYISDFVLSDLTINPVTYHKNVLNIIGERLRKFPQATISLRGFSDSTTEKASCNLASNRAESVRDYLVSVWGVNKNRINILVNTRNCTPFEPTMTKNDSGYADNRRVEIQSDNDEILAAIVQERYQEARNISPSILKIEPEGMNYKNISSSSITARQGSKVFLTRLFNGAPQSFSEALTSEKIANLKSGEPVIIELRATDFDGEVYTAESKIAIQKDTSDTEIQRLSLILFGVSSDVIPDRAKQSLREFVLSANHGMKASVIGYSDVLGQFGNNLALSERRAQNVSRYIREKAPDLEIIETRGIGSAQMPPGIYSYTTPSERFLTRTVYIELLKKWKK